MGGCRLRGSDRGAGKRNLLLTRFQMNLLIVQTMKSSASMNKDGRRAAALLRATHDGFEANLR